MVDLMATARQQRALSQQLVWIGTVQSLAVSYGKPQLAADLGLFMSEVEAGTLTWDANRESQDEAPAQEPYVEERTTGWVVCNKQGAIVARDFYDAADAHAWLDEHRDDPAALATPQ